MPTRRPYFKNLRGGGEGEDETDENGPPPPMLLIYPRPTIDTNFLGYFFKDDVLLQLLSVWCGGWGCIEAQ